MVYLIDWSGLGMEFDENEAQGNSHGHGFQLVNRLRDGTL